jgi:hypothetical protein
MVHFRYAKGRLRGFDIHWKVVGRSLQTVGQVGGTSNKTPLVARNLSILLVSDLTTAPTELIDSIVNAV